MILAIDGYEANMPLRVGVGRYAFELISGIARKQRSAAPPFAEVRVYVPQRPGEHMPKETEYFRYRVAAPRKLWTLVGLPIALSLDQPPPDVVFSPTHYIPRWVGTPRVMAIMDVSYLSYPELFRSEDLHKLVHWTEYSVRHAAKIITISEFSKRAIIEAYRVPESHVVIAYPALPDAVTNRVMDKSLFTNTLPKRYILSVGTLQPRKNFSRLIESFSRLDDKDIALVIVGKKGWLYDDILLAPKKFGVSDRVYFLDFVSDSQLPQLYKGAACFALPSLYEGFGLPVLEAMAHGIPVVVSDTSSLPEIAGDSGIYVKPENVESIAEGLTIALTEKAAARKKRIAAGKRRVAGFTWEKAANTVMETLQDVVKKGNP